jgi:DNA-binding transcriptional LysR family regulator
MAHDLNAAVIFAGVVREGSFTAAAHALQLPKTTVSRKVQDLELWLGAQLLNRTTRRMSLTEAGAVYFQHCEDIARKLDEAEAAVGQLRGEPRGALRITASYSVMLSLVAPLLGEFSSLYPLVRLDLALSHRTLDLLKDGIDIALRLGSLPDSSMAARHLGVLANRVYASPAYLARRGEPRRPDELARHLALTTRVAEQGNRYAWPMTDGGELRDYEINPVIVADDPEALKEPLFAGAGLMMATDLIMRRHADEGRVQAVLPGWLGRCPELHAVFPRGHIQPPKLRAFIDFLVSKLAGANALTSPPTPQSER